MSVLEQVSPSANNYMRGGTRVYVRETGQTGFDNLGNIVSAPMTLGQNVKEHISGYDGNRVIDAILSFIDKIEWTIKCDENTTQNIRYWLHGDAPVQTTRAASSNQTKLLVDILGLTAPSSTESIAAVLNKWFPIGTDINGLGDTVSCTKGSSPIALTEGVDYRVDRVAGMFMLMKTVAPTTDLDVASLHYSLVELDKQVFNKVNVIDWTVQCEGWYMFEGGKVRDRWYVPNARLRSAGTQDTNIENPKEQEFQLVQLKDPLLGWGTFQRFQTK